MSPAIDARTSRRNVLLLALSQGLFMIGTSTMIAEAALVGYALAENKSLATLPTGLQQLMVMVTAIPASFLMQRIGRRWGFTIGAMFGMLGAAVATLGVFQSSFVLFCLGTVLTGIYNGFGQFYRFAAVDGSTADWRSKAISYTLAGGVIAAVIGPELAKATKDTLAPVAYAGSFAALIGVAFVAMLVLQFIQIPPPSVAERSGGGRKLSEIARNPTFVVAVLAAMVGYGGMAFVMTVTPLAMVAHHHHFDSAAFVIQWHVLAMFAPSFFTGGLIARFGVLRIMTAGALLFVAALAVNLSGAGVPHFWTGLVLVGLAWNFLYIGGTALLTQAYQPAEKAKVQAANDFLVFGSVAFCALSSGALHERYGWDTLNIVLLPFILITLAAILWLHFRPRRPVAV
jgi:predicted MFS family arabinose efflux permease